MVFQESFDSIQRKFKWYFKDISRVFYGNSRVIQGSINGVPREFVTLIFVSKE